MIEADTIKCEEVIIARVVRRGDGVNTPIRIITQVFTKSGELIAEHDPCPKVEVTVKGADLVSGILSHDRHKRF